MNSRGIFERDDSLLLPIEDRANGFSVTDSHYNITLWRTKVRLVDDLYCYIWQGRGNNCNSYLFADVLRGGRPHILIDPGHVTNELNEHCLGNLLSSLARDGFYPADIGLIINTHSHIDHRVKKKWSRTSLLLD